MLRRENILITEDYMSKTTSATHFTAPGEIEYFDSSIHFGKESDRVEIQNCNIKNNILVHCSKEDTYDFETGALIALMKMCGRDKVIKACDELYKDDNYKNALQEMTENNEKLMKENKKLQHEYNLCKNSENALKCSVDYLNKTIAKLNAAIHGYKEDLYKVTKRCEELEIKESTLNKQQEQLDKREEKISVYFGGRGNGKQYKALVELFKKLPKDKVQAAYVAAYKESLIWCTSQPSIRDSLTVDSLIEQGRAFTRKCVEEWLYKPHTKRDEMWVKIVTNDKVVVKVKKEDINIFLKELETRNDVIRWITNLKPTEALTNPVLNRNAHSEEHCYFYLESNCILWYDTSLQDNHKDFIQIDYLPPMRWDLFKKGRLVVKVDVDNYEDFYNKCEVEIGRKPHYTCKGTFTVYYKNGTFHTRPYKDTIPFAKKIVDWEDVDNE